MNNMLTAAHRIYLPWHLHSTDRGGQEVWIQGTDSPILHVEGRPRKIVKIAADISRPVARDGEVQQRLVESRHFHAGLEHGDRRLKTTMVSCARSSPALA
jgi:hypothetical protein